MHIFIFLLYVSFHLVLSWFGRSFAISSLALSDYCVLLIAFLPYHVCMCFAVFIFVSNSDFVHLRFGVSGIYIYMCVFLLLIYKLHSYIAPTQNTFIFYLYLHRFGMETATDFQYTQPKCYECCALSPSRTAICTARAIENVW